VRLMSAIRISRLAACSQVLRAAAWMGIPVPRAGKDMLRPPPYIELTPYRCVGQPDNSSHRQGPGHIRWEPRMIPRSVSWSKFLALPRGHRQDNR
jgi:hypothetical protein